MLVLTLGFTHSVQVFAFSPPRREIRRGIRERTREGGKGPVVEGRDQGRREGRMGTSRQGRGQVEREGARGRRMGPNGEGKGK